MRISNCILILHLNEKIHHNIFKKLSICAFEIILSFHIFPNSGIGLEINLSTSEHSCSCLRFCNCLKMALHCGL